MKFDPEYKEPNRFLSGAIGVLVLITSGWASLWICGRFSMWLETLLGDRGMGPKALLTLLPLIVLFGSYLLLLVAFLFLFLMLAILYKKIFGHVWGAGPGKAPASIPQERRSGRKDAMSSVVILDGSSTPAREMSDKDPVMIFVSAFGLLVWTFCFWMDYQTKDSLNGSEVLIYGTGAVLFALLFHYGMHHRHEIVRNILPASRLSPRQGLAVGLGMVLFLWGAGGFVAWYSQQRLQRDTRSAQGVVTRLVYHRGSRSGSYRVEVNFTDLQDRPRTVECWGGALSLMGFLLPDPDDKVEVFYDPNDPTDATIKNFGNQWSMPAFLWLFGALGLFAVIRRYRMLGND